MTRTRTVATLAHLGALALATAASIATVTIAAVADAQPAGSAAPVSLCSLQGSAEMPVDLALYDQYQGGKAFARFTGAKTAVTAQRFPTDPKRGRVSVGAGTGFRIEGFVDATQLPVFTTREIAVPGGVVWLGGARQVRVVGATASDLQVEMELTQPMHDTFRAAAPCNTFTLTPGVPPAWSVPGNARGYVIEADQVELYASADAERNVVTTIDRAAGLLMWSTERRGSMVKVEYHGEVVIDAWAKAGDFRALPPGETEDRQRAPTSRRQAPRLALAEQPREVTTTAQVTVRTAAQATASVAGTIDPGTTIYVLDVMAGWASVLPKALDVVPQGEGGFWVKASDLGLGSR